MRGGFLKNLGLGEGSALPVGVPVPWPSATPPAGWLKCNGAAFSAATYPLLAKAYPTLKLPDLRGEFICGWDDGRGVDAGRPLLEPQLDSVQQFNGLIDGYFDFKTATGIFKTGNYGGGAPVITNDNSGYHQFVLDSTLAVRSAAETRPRNIAFNYIVRAA